MNLDGEVKNTATKFIENCWELGCAFSLLTHRMRPGMESTRRRAFGRSADCKSAIQQITNLRYDSGKAEKYELHPAVQEPKIFSVAVRAMVVSRNRSRRRQSALTLR